jgi:hypothetical protein
MLRCFAIERQGNPVSLGEVRWAIATLRDLGETSADRFRKVSGGNSATECAPNSIVRGTLADRLVEIHTHGIDKWGELVTLCFATLANLLMHIPGHDPPWNLHETAVKPH